MTYLNRTAMGKAIGLIRGYHPGLMVLALLMFLWCPYDAWGDLYLNHPYVSLSWQPNSESDTKGYEIYRSNSNDGLYTKANSGVVTGAAWTDGNVVEGVEYYYKLRALDLCGNVSDFSPPSQPAVIDLTTPNVAASPPAGTYSQGITVSLVPSETCTIYYTTDGTTPSKSSAVYSSPIPIAQNTTLRFFAVDLAANQSPIMTSQYFIQTQVHEIDILSGPGGSPNPAASGQMVACSVSAADTLGHNLNYRWSAAAGTFADPTVPNTGWTAPHNISGAIQYYKLTVTVSCNYGGSATSFYNQAVLPYDNQVPIADAGPDQSVQGSASVRLNGCESYDPDNGPSPLSYNWRQTGGNNIVQLAGPDTCNPTFVAPDTSDALTFTLQVSDGQDTAQDAVTIAVDAVVPQLLPESLGPYPEQGFDGGSGAPADTCIRAQVLYNSAVDLSTLPSKPSIHADLVYPTGATEEIPGEMVYIEQEPGLIWLMLVPDYKTTYASGLPHGLQVNVTIQTSGAAGTPSEQYDYRFKVRDSEPPLPVQTRSNDPNPDQPGDIMYVTLEEGKTAGTRMEYLDTTAVEPRFGQLIEVPAKDSAGGPHALSLNLEPSMVFQDPVKLLIPLPGAKNLQKYRIYHYEPNPALGWQEAVVGDGWLEYREDHELSEPPAIEIWVNHFTGLSLENDQEEAESGASVNASCFIATAAYGSSDAEAVLTFRRFRDRYLITNQPGRIFVRAYYRYSPPLAQFISRHEFARSAVRCGLSIVAPVCESMLAYPGASKFIFIGTVLFSVLPVLLIVIFKRRCRLKRCS